MDDALLGRNFGSPRIVFTQHAQDKMRHYRLSESFVKRAIRHPVRREQGIIGPETVAVMKNPSTKKYSEVWVLFIKGDHHSLRVISAWRYPGYAPKKDPVPESILQEIQAIIS